MPSFEQFMGRARAEKRQAVRRSPEERRRELGELKRLFGEEEVADPCRS